MTENDHIVQHLPDPLAPKTHADELRHLAMQLMRGLFQCAEMEDAAWSRDPELMLRTLRESREFIRQYYGERGMPGLLDEFERTEIKILKTIHKVAS